MIFYPCIFLCLKLSTNQGKNAQIMENNHHLSQSQLGVFWFLTKLTWSMQLTTAWCWLNLNITNFIENRHFTDHNIVAKFRSSYYIDRNIVNNRKPYTKNFLTTCQVSHYDFPQNSSYTLNPYMENIVALSLKIDLSDLIRSG